MLDYTKYETNLKSVAYYRERMELQSLQKLSNLTPAQQLRIQELKKFIEEAQKQNDLYHNEKDRLYKLWKNDLYETYGVKDNPKADKALKLAYDYGHSYGQSTIESYFSDLVELIL